MNESFPYLDVDDYIAFPPVTGADDDGLLCQGGNLSPGILLSAYRQGIFPWHSDDRMILWWSPDPRCLLFPNDFHASKRLLRSIRRQGFSFSLDRCFEQVMRACRSTPRVGQEGGAWITPGMLKAYQTLHRCGYAHSVETWLDGSLCGGLYGVSLGAAFFGESMFSGVSDASKAAMAVLVEFARLRRFLFIDCQLPTPHLLSLGATTVAGAIFYRCSHVRCGTIPYAGAGMRYHRNKWRSCAWPVSSNQR